MGKNIAILSLSAALGLALAALAFVLLGVFGVWTKWPFSPKQEAPIVAVDENPAVPTTPEPEPVEPSDPLVAALTEIFDEAQKNERFAGAAIGFCLLDPEGEVLYGYKEEIAQIPASSLKTLTTATALEVLGPEFRFQTRLGISAPKGENADEADLILLGGGDPMLSPEDLEKWAKGLVEAGLQSIPGRVIGDGRAVPGPLFVDFWNWGDIGNAYGSPVSGLNFAHNRYTAVLMPGEKVGDPAQLLGTMPEVPGVTWWTDVTTSEQDSGDGLSIYGGEHASVIHLRGTVPLGEPWEARAAVPDPERFAAYHLRASLLAAGVLVHGEAVSAGELFLNGETVPEIEKELLVHPSPPLIEIVKSIHDQSDNHETECVYRALGMKAGTSGSQAIRDHWQQRGLELTGLRQVDGSGLSRADHIPPKTLARVQHFAATGPQGKTYVDSLMATGGDRIHYKAGNMSSIRSYTGLFDRGADQLAFALIINHYTDLGAVHDLQEAVFTVLLSGKDEG